MLVVIGIWVILRMTAGKLPEQLLSGFKPGG